MIQKETLMIVGIFNLPTALSFVGLILSILACIFSFNKYIELSIICLMYAGLADLFDGFLARKLKIKTEEKMFGIQIDSIIDMASFGLVPVIILLHYGFNTIIAYILFFIYCCCAAMRLAYFNCLKLKDNKEIKYYTGLPVTYSALIIPLAFISSGFLPDYIFEIVIYIIILIISLLFILKIPILKPRGVFYILFPIIAVVLSIYWIGVMITRYY